MTKITIETYRGFDIEFDIQFERFQCIITDNNQKESKSFSAIKKFVDNYIKDNQEFKSFFVEPIPDKGRGKIIKIVGIRKDNRFVCKDQDGNHASIPNYDMDEYMLVKEENVEFINKIKDLEKDFEHYKEVYLKNKRDIKSKLNIVTLKDYSKTKQKNHV